MPDDDLSRQHPEQRHVDCLSRGKTLKLHPASSVTNVLISKLERAVSCTNKREKLVPCLFLPEITQHRGHSLREEDEYSVAAWRLWDCTRSGRVFMTHAEP